MLLFCDLLYLIAVCVMAYVALANRIDSKAKSKRRPPGKGKRR